MTENSRLLDGEYCDINCTEPEKRYERKKAEGRSLKARTALLTAMVLMLPALYLLGRPYPRLVPSIWNPHIPPQMQFTQVTDEIKYLVWNPQCRILAIDPHSKESMELFRKANYMSCSTAPQYVYMEKNEKNQSALYINKTALSDNKLKRDSLSCCYINITRSDVNTKVMKSACSHINDSVVLLDTEEFVMAKCSINSKLHRDSHKSQFSDVFMNVQPSEEVQKRLLENNNIYKEQQYWNVLIIGVDTLSRINLVRAMPKTHQFLKNNSWLDFQGYNKMDDNTFPNLMAILTGRNSSRARSQCDGEGQHSLDNCDFMWKTFQKAGYVTAYAEDDIGIDTFEKPYHKGFVHKPTDHYLRPLFVVAEKFNNKYSKGSVFCTGQKTSGEVLFQYALEFVETYKNDPYFGFFWANTFSHNDVGSPSSMDQKVADFLNKLNNFDRTIVLFISDHGIRFGKMRSTLSGYYEERLPAFFMYVPEKFKEIHKNAHLSLIANSKRLISPYDVFMTLQDILYLSGRREVTVSSEACPMCQSIFQAVPWNRSCADCSITPHWCTCNPLKPLPPDHKEAILAINYIINVVIEDAISTVNTNKCRKCAKLSLHKVINVYVYDYLHNPSNVSDYLVVFSTSPGDMIYEATVNYNRENKTFTQIGIVSRLSVYKGTGSCVKTAYLKKYCYCTKKCK